MVRKKYEGPLAPLVNFLSAFGLACFLLACLFVLVFSATLRYGVIGEAGVKQEFFIPWIVDLNGIPFPGGLTVFSLLALNLFVGGLARIRWSRRTAGIIIAHFGIVGLVAAGVVNWAMSDYGYVQIYEGETKNTYRDYTLIELAVWDAAEQSDVREFVVSDANVRSCSNQGRVFTSPEIPFELELSGFLKHCRAQPKGPMWEAASPVVEGWALEKLDDSIDPHNHQPGVVARVTSPAGTEVGLLTARDVCAWTVEVDGKLWALHLHHVRHRLPFALELIDATREDHPGTRTPRVYKSDVIYGDTDRKVTISMNHPLRTEGHVLFQNQWGIDRRGEFSGFSVARNPSDQWPKWMAWVIGAGLLLAFVQRLYQYTVAQARLRSKEA